MVSNVGLARRLTRYGWIEDGLTLFSDERVVSVVGVVSVSKTSMGVLKLQELVAMLARVASAEN